MAQRNPTPGDIDRLPSLAKTSLISLVARAWDADSTNPILGDTGASKLVKAFPANLDEYRLPVKDIQRVAIRTRQFDAWTTQFLKGDPDALIVHLACGFDGRTERVPWANTTHWIDVDIKEVIDLRRQLMKTSFENKSYRLVEADILTEEWLHEIPTDHPTAVVMEGLLSYLKADEVRRLLSRLVNHFSHGEIYFDCISTVVLNASHNVASLEVVRKTGAVLQSSMDDLSGLEEIGNAARVQEVVHFVEAPGVEKLPWARRLQMYLLSWVPGARDGARLVRLRFGDQDVGS